MRVAVDIRCLTNRHLTGVGLYTLNLVKTMAHLARNDEFILYASGTNETLDRLPKFSAANITIVERPVPNKIHSTLLKLPGGPALEDSLPAKPDLWLFPHPHIVKTRIPYVATIHDLTLEILPEFFTLRDHLRDRLAQSRRMAENATRLLAVSHSTARDLLTYWKIDAERTTVTPLGVDATFGEREQPSDRSFRAAYDLNQPYLLSLCTLEPRKNIESIIEAYDTFRKEGGRALPLVLAGGKGWKTKGIEEALRKATFAKDIRRIGYVPEKHKAALYRGAHVFLFPSFYEGFGLPVLEAMACGTPVITSFTSSLPEVAGDAALYVDPFNVTDITQALHILFGDGGSDVRRTLKARSIARAQHFAWTNTALKTLDVLRSASRQ